VGQVEQPPTVFVFPLSALQQLVMAQSARANQTLEIDEGSINVVRRAGVAKDLPAHAAVVPSTVHCKRFFAPIANLAQLIGHPKLAQLLLQMNVWVQQVVLIPLTVVLLALLFHGSSSSASSSPVVLALVWIGTSLSFWCSIISLLH
jgi:hypothetical protein